MRTFEEAVQQIRRRNEKLQRVKEALVQRHGAVERLQMKPEDVKKLIEIALRGQRVDVRSIIENDLDDVDEEFRVVWGPKEKQYVIWPIDKHGTVYVHFRRVAN